MSSKNIKMNILMFSVDYWPNSGGIAAHVYYLSRALAAKGVNVTVIGGYLTPITKGRDKQTDLPNSKNIREITIHRWGPKGFRGLNFMLRAWGILNRLSNSWDIIHYHNFIPDGLLLGTTNWPYARAKVMTNHSHAYLEAIDQNKNLNILRFSVQKANGIIGPSPELRDKTKCIIREGQFVEYIPNGVDTTLFSPGDAQRVYQRLGISRERKILLAVRRHDPKCGLRYLIQAMPEIIRYHPEVYLYLVGDGIETPLLKAMVEQYGLSQWVQFFGRLPHSNLPELYRAAYVSILPSLYEAVSLSGLESLSCKCPVIGTNIGGIPEFIKEGETGILVDPKSPEGLAESVLYLLDNPNLREQLSSKSRPFIENSFSWDIVADKTLAFYERLLQENERIL